LNWNNVTEDTPFPEATKSERRELVVKTHSCHTIAVHCAWDHTGEEQPIFGPDWYWWNGHSMSTLKTSEVTRWKEI